MLNKYWKQFKSGTDIRGVATDSVKGEKINLTDDVIKRISFGFALWMIKKVNKPCNAMKISIGHDSRVSAERIKSCVIEILVSLGINVLDCGLSSTPAMFMTTVDLSCDGAIQITASHHPFNRNGLKFFTKAGGLESSDIDNILQLAQNENFYKGTSHGKVESINFMDFYSNHLREIIKEGINSNDYDYPLKGFKIVVDAGNGAGGFYANNVLEPLGADIRGSQFLEPDGMFPNHIPNPENEGAMRSISEATVEAKADLGVIFDTDVDRGGAVDSSGKEINRNRLVAVVSAIALEGNKGGTIVTDSITSSGLKDYIENELQGKHHRFKRGYKNVINEAIRLNNEGINCPLAIETSGHAALRENYFLDDGAYLVTKIIIKMANLKKEGKKLESLIENLSEPLESEEFRLVITEENFKDYGNKVIEGLKRFAKSKNGWKIANDNYEGIRVSFDKNNGDGWFLLRLSVHDPIMPLNIESNSNGGVKIILNMLYEYIKDCDGLDISKVKDYIS